MDTMVTKNITRPKTLNRVDARLLATLSEKGQDIFTTQMAAEILGQTSLAVRKRLHNLVQRRWLQRLEKGKYLIVPLSAGLEGHYTENELVIASHLVSPYYISYWTALSYYGYTEQPSHTVYIATKKQKKPVIIHGLTYRFVRLQPRKFFGYMDVWIGEKLVRIAEREKAIADAIDYPELSGGIIHAVKGIWRGREELDLNKLIDDGLQMGNRAIAKRLGFLLQLLGFGKQQHLERLEKSLSAGYAVLDPLSPRKGRHDAQWRVIVNVSEDELLNWRET
jgi:predicted transcriptional regulator of viral defense system